MCYVLVVAPLRCVICEICGFKIFLSVLGSVSPEHCIEILTRMQQPILHFVNRWSAINLNLDLVPLTKVYLYPHFCPDTVGCNSPLKKGDSGGCVFSGYSPFSRGQVYNPLDPPFPKWDFYASLCVFAVKMELTKGLLWYQKLLDISFHTYYK